ncbi:hypothetical protein GJAV_G00196410 [Gymnothorax javanicus]|nr:hypothetical protein GJAV_G00196410 [Gymnothorax javanicus]
MASMKLNKKPREDKEEKGENVYVTMEGCRAQSRENREEEAAETEDPVYVTCQSLGSLRTEAQSMTGGDTVDARWTKSDRQIHKSRTGSTLGKRTELFPNGSLLIKTANANDSGNYTVDLWDQSGRHILKTNIELIVLDVVSQPVIRSSCTVTGNLLLTCWVEGENQVWLQWAGHTNLSKLPQLTLLKKTEQSLSLFSYMPDHVICRVSVCIAFGLFLGIMMCSMALLKFNKKPREDKEGDKSEDPQEIAYCLVQVGENKGEQKREQEHQVVYGEVKLPEDARC